MWSIIVGSYELMRPQTRYSSNAFWACNLFWFRPLTVARLTFAALTLASTETGCTGGVDASADEVLQQSLLCVQPVFRFVPHHALRSVDDLGGDFLAAMCGQAVHEHRVGFCRVHHPRVDHPAGEGSRSLFVLSFETHAGPHVGRDEVDAAASGDRSGEGLQMPRVVPGCEPGIDLVAGRRRDVHLEIEDRRGLQPRAADVVRVADPGHGLADDRAAMLDVGVDVREDLARVILVGETVDDRHP